MAEENNKVKKSKENPCSFCEMTGTLKNFLRVVCQACKGTGFVKVMVVKK